MRLKVSSAKRRPFCLGHNVLTEKLRQGSVMVWLISYQKTSNVHTQIDIKIGPTSVIVVEANA